MKDISASANCERGEQRLPSSAPTEAVVETVKGRLEALHRGSRLLNPRNPLNDLLFIICIPWVVFISFVGFISIM